MVNISADYEWISSQNLHKFRGQWIAVFNKKIISSGEFAHDVAKKAQEQIQQTPFLIKVPLEGYLSV